jgi:hypothetical protein
MEERFDLRPIVGTKSTDRGLSSHANGRFGPPADRFKVGSEAAVCDTHYYWLTLHDTLIVRSAHRENDSRNSFNARNFSSRRSFELACVATRASEDTKSTLIGDLSRYDLTFECKLHHAARQVIVP